MEKFVWKVGDNETGNKWTVYVTSLHRRNNAVLGLPI